MSTDSAAARRIDLDPLVHAKEKLYFGMSVLFSIAVYAFLVVTILSTPEAAGVVIDPTPIPGAKSVASGEEVVVLCRHCRRGAGDGGRDQDAA